VKVSVALSTRQGGESRHTEHANEIRLVTGDVHGDPAVARDEDLVHGGVVELGVRWQRVDVCVSRRG